MADRASPFVKAFAPGRVSGGVLSSTLTTWAVGGPIEVLVQPWDENEAARAVRMAGEEGLGCWIMGRGSNLLVSDRGIRGVVVRPGSGFDAVQFRGDRVIGEPGVMLPVLARECARRGLSGLEFGVGIPGSLGGAVATNAGAQGSDVGGIVERVQVLRRSGTRESWESAYLEFGYRRSRLLDEPALLLSAVLQLVEADPQRVEARTSTLLEKRTDQPAGRSAGSVFRNPEGDHAGRLLEQAGAKGMVVGGARVPDAHANFIVTEEGSSARDVLRLIKILQDRVSETAGTLLAPEIVFAGFEAEDPDLPRGARLLGEIT